MQLYFHRTIFITNTVIISNVIMLCFKWEDAKRAYLKFIDNEIITRHITRNPCTLRYTYSYTLIYKNTLNIYKITDCYIKNN